MYKYYPLTTKTYPTLPQVVTAIQQAEIGNVNTRDTRPLSAILSRIAVASPRLSGHILTRKTAVSSFGWTLNLEQETDNTEKVLQKAITAVIHACIDVNLFGAFALGLKWTLEEIEGKKIFIPAVERVFHQVELEKDFAMLYELDENNNKTPLEQSQNILFATDKTSWLGGNLRSIIVHEILRNENLIEWASFNKKLKGIIQAKSPNEEKADASNALKNITANNYSVTSKDVEFVFNDVSSSKAVESFKEFKSQLESDIAIAVLGQANVTQLPNSGGSRAALQVQNMIRADIMFSDMNVVREVINEQLLPYFYQMNFDKNAKTSPYRFEFIYDNVQDFEANARAIESSLRAGVPLPSKEVYEKLGFSVPQQGEDVIQPQKALL